MHRDIDQNSKKGQARCFRGLYGNLTIIVQVPTHTHGYYIHDIHTCANELWAGD